MRHLVNGWAGSIRLGAIRLGANRLRDLLLCDHFTFFFSDQFIDRADERTAWTAPELCYKTYDGTAGVTNSDVRVSQVVGNSVLRRKNGRDKIFSGNQGKEPQNRGDGFGEAGSKD